MKAKIFTSLILGMMFLSASLGQAQNILSDGEFSTTTAINNYFNQPEPDNVWFSWQNWQINNNVTVVGGVCHYEVVSLGAEKNTWDIQLIQKGFPLILGHSYRLTFDVKADANRSFGLFLGENGGLWTSIIGYNNYAQFATTYWKTRTIDFVATAVFSSHKLSFELGAEQVATYFDNVMLVDMGMAMPSIGILGTGLNGWEVDVDMQTIDGIKYTLYNYPLNAGVVKFRQDNAWIVNWGSNTFPSGAAYQDGPDIPIPILGNYDITFNRITGEYFFFCVSNCPASVGILGSAVPPDFSWNKDVNMGTIDGINYTLKNYTFVDGEAKFRQDDSWNVNWGSTTFPKGTALSNGPNIPVKAGAYNVTFNSVTGDYSFEFPMIGVIGSALNGWNDDVDMQTTDGITYTLLNYPFMDGFAKFRQDNNWDVNWGAYTFPTGWAFQYGYGNDIPVPAGTYNVTFNRVTGEYIFVATTCPIAGIQCFGGYGVSEPGMCGAYVNFYEDPKPTPNCGGEGIKIEQISGLPSGSFFPTGYTTNTFLLTNTEGQTATCSSTVYVDGDYEPPVVTGIADELPPIWPPNHKMVPVYLDYNTTDNCDQNSISQIFYVYSNEPDNGLGEGDLANDWEIVDEHNILLRAERSGTGTGRVYYISILSHDNSNNFSVKVITVTVPHDKGKVESIASTTKPRTINHKAILGDAAIENVPFASNVWPNPSSGDFKLEVQSSSNENAVLSIFDINGRLVSNVNAGSQQTISFGENLKAGIYMVVVRQGNNSNTFKVVKQ
jgi:hypothetical protein